jgi:hypothetical protein
MRLRTNPQLLFAPSRDCWARLDGLRELHLFFPREGNRREFSFL